MKKLIVEPIIILLLIAGIFIAMTMNAMQLRQQQILNYIEVHKNDFNMAETLRKAQDNYNLSDKQIAEIFDKWIDDQLE